MRKLFPLLFLAIVSSTVFAQTSELNAERNAGFDKLSFEIELNKKNYLPLEPLFVKFKVVNRTPVPLAADRPQFLLDSRLKVMNIQGEMKEVTSLTTSLGRALPLPGPIPVLNPNGSYEQETVPAIDLGVLAEPGIYRIQFMLYGGGSGSIESNVVEITIENPQDIDKEAFDFLNRHGKDVWFGKVFFEAKGVDLLKTFVERFGESTYGEYAIQSLGRYYSYKGKFDEAKAEFEKLESSSNTFLVKQAKKDLADNAKRKADRAKREQPK